MSDDTKKIISQEESPDSDCPRADTDCPHADIDSPPVTLSVPPGHISMAVDVNRESPGVVGTTDGVWTRPESGEISSRAGEISSTPPEIGTNPGEISSGPDEKLFEPGKGPDEISSVPGESPAHPGEISPDETLPPLVANPERARAAMEEVLKEWEKKPVRLRRDAPALVSMLSQLPGLAPEDQGELAALLHQNRVEIGRRMALAPDDSHTPPLMEIDAEYAAREAKRQRDFLDTFGVRFDHALQECFGADPPQVDHRRVPLVRRRWDVTDTHDPRVPLVPEKVKLETNRVPYSGEFNPNAPLVRLLPEQLSSDREETVKPEPKEEEREYTPDEAKRLMILRGRIDR